MVFDKNETVVCELKVYSDEAKTILYTPDSVTITIYDPDDNKVVDNVTVSPDNTGIFHYDYLPTVAGIYRVEWTITTGTRTVIKKGEFVVE